MNRGLGDKIILLRMKGEEIQIDRIDEDCRRRR